MERATGKSPDVCPKASDWRFVGEKTITCLLERLADVIKYPNWEGNTLESVMKNLPLEEGVRLEDKSLRVESVQRDPLKMLCF